MSISLNAPTLEWTASNASETYRPGAGPEDSLVLAGELRGFSPTAIAQLLELEGKSCLLRMRHGDQCGDLAFSRGRLIDARTGDDTGEDAALVLLAWQVADVQIFDLPASDTAVIQRSLSDLILEAAQLYDEKVRDAWNDAGLEAWLEEESQNLVVHGDDVGDLPEIDTDRLDAAIAKLLSLDGARRVALVDLESARTLRVVTQGAAEDPRDADYDFRLPGGFGAESQVEDVLTTLADRYHLVRPLCACRRLSLHLTLDRSRSNLALARHCLARAESRLCVD